MMPKTTQPLETCLWPIVQQHVEEAIHLHHVRSKVLVRSPHVGLLQLARHDERIASHIDGMVVSVAAARQLVLDQLQELTPAALFAAATLALLSQDSELLNRVLDPATLVHEARRGVAAAFGWVEAPYLRGVVRDLLGSDTAAKLALGIKACMLHRVDPGPALEMAARHSEPAVQATAFRAASILGRANVLPLARASASAMQDAISLERAELALSAACVLCRFGEDAAALPTLHWLSGLEGKRGLHALHIGMAALPRAAALELARTWCSAARTGGSPLAARREIQSIGLLGDVAQVPRLIERMADPQLARLAAEAFSWITGADLGAQDLELLGGPPRPDLPDDPSLVDASIDEDENLPWPDQAKVLRWWQEHRSRFTGPAPPLFLGRASRDEIALIGALSNANQRQRHHAAWLLALARPGSPIFPVSAPSRRQRALLANLGSAGTTDPARRR